MAPISKYALGALCVFAACPTFAAPIQSTVSLDRRQLAGTGAAADSILTDTDNGVGYGTKNAEENLAATITVTKGSAPHARSVVVRQLDKIADGAGDVANAAGAGQQAAPVVSEADEIDGDTTSDQALVGQQVGQLEEETLENAGNAVPKA